MSKKDEASPRQRQIMEQRWEKVRARCGQGVCAPWDAMHAKGCARRQQKIKVTNLNTGVTSEATIVHSDVRAVKGVLDQHEKQAVHLEPVGEEYWDAFERGEPRARVIPVPKPEDVRALTPDEEAIRDTFLSKLEREMLPAPARPWWKFWGRRG